MRFMVNIRDLNWRGVVFRLFDPGSAPINLISGSVSLFDIIDRNEK